MREIVKQLFAPGKGLLAADESFHTAGVYLEGAGIKNIDAEMRRQYRDLFLSGKGVEMYLSGVILFDETIHQKAGDGTPFPQLLERKGIVPGIKVDGGLEPLPGSPDETRTKGLEGLDKRLAEYRAMGARFAKWRSAFPIADGLPSDESIKVNAQIMAKYAKLCQAADIVPIVEPEVLIGGDHDLETSEKVLGRVLDGMFAALDAEGVDRPTTILKTSMAIAGKECANQSGPEEVGEATARVLLAHVPKNLGGVVFLSGGQTPVEATENLNAIERRGPYPWPLTFSYARALQAPSLNVWKGDPHNVEAARAVFLRRLELNSLAALGKYEGE